MDPCDHHNSLPLPAPFGAADRRTSSTSSGGGGEGAAQHGHEAGVNGGVVLGATSFLPSPVSPPSHTLLPALSGAAAIATVPSGGSSSGTGGGGGASPAANSGLSVPMGTSSSSHPPSTLSSSSSTTSSTGTAPAVFSRASTLPASTQPLASRSSSIPSRTFSQTIGNPSMLHTWRELRAQATRALECIESEPECSREKDAVQDLLRVLLRYGQEDTAATQRPERRLYEDARHFARLTAELTSSKPMWPCCPKNILVLKKHQDVVVAGHLRTLVGWLAGRCHIEKIHVEMSTFEELKTGEPLGITNLVGWSPENADEIDFVVLLGGDGTLLHTATLFQGIVPPVLSFALGSLGFLTPFPFRDFDETLTNVFEGSCEVNMRMRLQCEIQKASGSKVLHVLNELVLDRGPTPYVTRLEVLCNGNVVTTVQGDGLIIATPTGSTAYSVAAGGSMVHPELTCFLITPICPHSLSFRPVIVPATVTIEVRVLSRSAWASMDGRNQHEMLQHESVKVTLSPYPVPTISRLNVTEDWFLGLSQCLSWNARESSARMFPA